MNNNNCQGCVATTMGSCMPGCSSCIGGCTGCCKGSCISSVNSSSNIDNSLVPDVHKETCKITNEKSEVVIDA